jgi:regulatory protein YycI of two-component signal transduction system YycFG
VPKKRKLVVRVNNPNSLENLMQETYNDACIQLNDAQRGITELGNKVDDENISNDDLAKIATSKVSYLKVKEKAINFKLELAKLQSSILKDTNSNTKEITNGAIDISDKDRGDILDDFKIIRDLYNNKSESNND